MTVSIDRLPWGMHKFLFFLLGLAALPHATAQSTVTLSCTGSISSRNLAANISEPAGATCC